MVFKKDSLLPIVLLLIFFAPLYLLSLHNVPVQVNTDEVTVMLFTKSLSATPLSNPLGLSGYFYFPSLVFIIFGTLARMIGGVTLTNMRLVHASFGLSIIFLTYYLFRTWTSRFSAFCIAILVGINHSLWSVSRMALRDNSGLFIELLALAILLRGLKNNSLLQAFLGGLAAGLSFYVYYPGRMTIFLWLGILISFALFLRTKFPLSILIKIGVVSTLGFFLISTPVIISTLQIPPHSDTHTTDELLIFPDGRKLQQQWLFATSEKEAIFKNITNGLTAFNRPLEDYSYIYTNPNHGFVDPISGALLWLGLAIALIKWFYKKEITPKTLVAFICFNIIFFTLSFIVNKAPNYTRMLIILPFFAYFVYLGIKTCVDTLAKLLVKIYPLPTNFDNGLTIIVLAVIIWTNALIYRDFVDQGFTTGNDVGSTARFVESKQGLQGYSFYLSANNSSPYYSWGQPSQWKDWFGFFKTDQQFADTVSPEDMSKFYFQKPFTLFVSNSLWERNRNLLLTKYPQIEVYKIKPDGSLLAIVVDH